MNRAIVIALAVVVGLAALAGLIAWRVHTHLAGIRQEREREEALKLNSTDLAHCGPVSCLRFSPDGEHLLAGSEGVADAPVPNWQGSLFMWNVKTLQKQADIVFDQRVRDLAFHPDGQLLAVCASNVNWHSPPGYAGFVAKPGEVILYKFPSLLEVKRMTIDGPLDQIGWSRKGKYFAVVKLSPTIKTMETELRVYDGINLQHLTTIKPFPGVETSFVFSPDETILYAVHNRSIHFYVTKTWQEAGSFVSPALRGHLSLSPDDRWIVVTPKGLSGHSELIDPVSQMRVESFPFTIFRERGSETLSQFSDNMKFILQTTNRGGSAPTGTSGIYIAEQDSGKAHKLKEVRQSYFGARAFSPDNNTFAVGVNGPVHRHGGGVILYHGNDLKDYFTRVP